jgi:hypothetical protein
LSGNSKTIQFVCRAFRRLAGVTLWVSVPSQEAKYVERWPSTTSAWAGWGGFDVPVDRYAGLLEYIPCYCGPAEHWGLLPATRLASRKILIEQNIKKRTGLSLCVLCGLKSHCMYCTICTQRTCTSRRTHEFHVMALHVSRRKLSNHEQFYSALSSRKTFLFSELSCHESYPATF